MQKAYRIGKIFRVVFTLIIILCLALFCFKPILKWIYPIDHDEYIAKYSKAYSLDPYLVMGIISVESGFDSCAESHKAAKGLMQIREDTARWCVKEFAIESDSDNFFEPELNIHIGCAYMSYLLDKYSGNTETALAAYNAGEGNVSKWLASQSGTGGESLERIPFEETENYVKKVISRTKIYRFLY